MAPEEIWIVASTLIFIAAVWRPLRRAVIEGLDTRRAAIIHDLEEAHRLREEAIGLLKDTKARHESAIQDAEAIVKFAKDEAKRLRQQAEADLQAHLKIREKQALDRIARAEEEAIADIKNKAVDLALSASMVLLRDKLQADAGDRLIEGAIAELPSKLKAV